VHLNTRGSQLAAHLISERLYNQVPEIRGQGPEKN